MTPREIIAKAAASDGWREGEYRMGMGETRNADELNAGHRAIADHILEALTSSGYRILGPGEWDAETVEKCAEVAEEYASYEQTEWGMGHRDACNSIANAIRALAKEKQGC